MKLTISTKAKSGQLICYVINANGLYILKLKDSMEGSCQLVPGATYRFEWHTWSSESAEYQIKAVVSPSNPGFPPFDFSRVYPSYHTDMGGFYFTIQP